MAKPVPSAARMNQRLAPTRSARLYQVPQSVRPPQVATVKRQLNREERRIAKRRARG